MAEMLVVNSAASKAGLSDTAKVDLMVARKADLKAEKLAGN